MKPNTPENKKQAIDKAFGMRLERVTDQVRSVLCDIASDTFLDTVLVQGKASACVDIPKNTFDHAMALVNPVVTELKANGYHCRVEWHEYCCTSIYCGLIEIRIYVHREAIKKKRWWQIFND